MIFPLLAEVANGDVALVGTGAITVGGGLGVWAIKRWIEKTDDRIAHAETESARSTREVAAKLEADREKDVAIDRDTTRKLAEVDKALAVIAGADLDKRLKVQETLAVSNGLALQSLSKDIASLGTTIGRIDQRLEHMDRRRRASDEKDEPA